MAQAPPSSLVQKLLQYRVPADETECGEYVYRMELERKKKPKKGESSTENYKYDVEEDLVRILSALLNTSGGIVQLRPKSPETHFRAKEFEEWRNTFGDKLGGIPENVLPYCISLTKQDDDLIYILVNKSRYFTTTNAHLYIRDMAKNRQVKDFNLISQVINFQTASRDNKLPLSGPFISGGKCTQIESQSLEFKHSNNPANTVEQLVEKLNNDRFLRAVFGMANLSGGGDIILGVSEDQKSKENMYVGQQLSEQQEEVFKSKLEELLQRDVTGNRRVWGDTTTVPKEGTHWTCKFIPLQMSTPSDTPQRRLVLVVIHIYHCLGGAFLQKPEAFVVNDDGYIEEVTFEEWLENHKVSAATTNLPEAEHSSKARDNQAEKPSTPCVSPHALEKSAVVPVITQKSEFKDNTCLRFTEHSSDYNENDMTNHPTGTVHHPEVIDLFRKEKPPRYNPNRDTIKHILSNHSLPSFLSNVEETLDEPGFGLATDSLWNCFQHSCASTSTPLQHVMDLLIVTESGRMVLSTAIAESKMASESNSLNAYKVKLARVLKKRMLEKISLGESSHTYPKLMFDCDLSNPDGSTKACPDFIEDWLAPKEHYPRTFHDICSSLACVLKNMSTCFRALISRDEDLCLASEQMETLVSLDPNRFSIIEGPPGCGKTILARLFCARKGPKDAAYISSSKALFNRAAANRDIRAYYAEDSATVLSLLQGDLKDVKHIVIDDHHRYYYSEDELHKLCKTINADSTDQRRFLHIFQDSKFQNYAERTNALKAFIVANEDIYGSVFIKTMNTIYRNSQVVGCFIKSQVSSLSDQRATTEVTCNSAVKGEDILVQQIDNLRNDADDNGLLKHIKYILDPSVNPQHPHYSNSDIAILVDHDDKEEARKEVKFFRSLLNTFLPHIPTQDAETVPVKGIIVDTLRNYMGLEAMIVIYIFPQGKLFDTGVPEHQTKHRIAIASRGIDRVDFLQESNLDGKKVEAMKFDQSPGSAVKATDDNDTDETQGPVCVWSNFEERKIRDLCWVSTGAHATLLYTIGRIDRRTVRGRSVGRVSKTGDRLPLTMDTSHMERPYSVTCTSDGEWVVVADRRDSDGSWTAYRGQSPGVYSRHSTVSLDGRPVSARITPQGHVVVMVYKPQDLQLYLCLYQGVRNPVPVLIWERPVSQSYLSPGGMFVAVNDTILLCGEDGIERLGVRDGVHIDTIPCPEGLHYPTAVCADPFGRLWVGDWNGSVWLCGAETGGQEVVDTGGGYVNSLTLHGKRYLTVATMRGSRLYDIQKYSHQ